MPAITGQDGFISLGGTMKGTLKEWRADVEEAKAIDQSTQGDDWETEQHVRNRFTGRGTLELPLAAYTTYMASVGSNVAFVGRIETALAFLAATVRITKAGVAVPVEDKVTSEFEFRGVGEPTLLT